MYNLYISIHYILNILDKSHIYTLYYMLYKNNTLCIRDIAYIDIINHIHIIFLIYQIYDIYHIINTTFNIT